MPTTSSPWASPSSPAGRRLLQSEPTTADDIPVLDAALLAQGAAEVAASAARAAARHPVAPSRPAADARCPRRRSVLRRGLVGAALVVALLGLGAGAGLDRPAPAASPTAATPVAPVALGHAAGAVVGSQAPPVAGGQVAVALIEPTEAVRAEVSAAPLARRLGILADLAAEQQAAG